MLRPPLLSARGALCALALLLLLSCALAAPSLPGQWRSHSDASAGSGTSPGETAPGSKFRDDDGEMPEGEDCKDNYSSTVWMCISTVLVLGMSPALALFEAGMLRSKSTVSLITQILSGVITLSVMWVLFGYSLTFGPDQSGFIGNFDNALFIDVSYTECSPFAPEIPEGLFAMFQMMFAVITPLLMTGSFAERLKFKSFIVFITVWQIVVYYPLAHWIWGGGWAGKWGVLDFAGGIVIHTSAGMGSLVAALYLGRRQHFFDFMGEFPPSNLPLAATGATLLWIGWFGFNGGSALSAGPVAVSAITSTQVGCSSGAFAWLVLAWWQGGKPQSVALMNGALAGLAGITPASGYVNTPASIGLGAVFGIASFFAVHTMKHRWHIDDALDVSSVHGLTGVLGALGLGLFAQHRLNPNGADGAFYGHPMQLVYQLVGVLVAAVWAGFWSLVLLILLDRYMGGIRLNADEEEVGMDWAEHQEIAYHKLHVLDDVSVAEQPHYGHGHSSPREDMGANLLDAHSANSDLSVGAVSPGLGPSPSPMPIGSNPSTAHSRMAMPTTHTYRRSEHGSHAASPAPNASPGL